LLSFDPCPAFSTDYYLSRYQDVKESGFNPFYHYLRFGRTGGRWPIDPDPDDMPDDRLRALLKDVFDTDFYLEKYTDIAEVGLDALGHYIDAGAEEGTATAKGSAQGQGVKGPRGHKGPRGQRAKGSSLPLHIRLRYSKAKGSSLPLHIRLRYSIL